MKLKVSDQIVVIAGKDKGKKGNILRILRNQKKVVVEKVNIRTKHIKKTTERPGEIIHFEAPIDASNVMVVCPDCGKPTRIGYSKPKNGKKERVCKKCNTVIITKVKAKK